MKRAVFLDRDGVINRALVRQGRPYPPKNTVELEIIPGVAKAVRALKLAGFDIIIVTNQPDVPRGRITRESVNEIHRIISHLMPIDHIECCYHDSDEGCGCRKPKPGMLLSASAALGVDLTCSYMVGDRWRDIEAGQLAGCETFFINYGYSEKQPNSPDHIVDSLDAAAGIILEREGINWNANEKDRGT